MPHRVSEPAELSLTIEFVSLLVNYAFGLSQEESEYFKMRKIVDLSDKSGLSSQYKFGIQETLFTFLSSFFFLTLEIF